MFLWKEGRKEEYGLFNDIISILVFCGRKEGNVLFNDVLSTFFISVLWKEGRKCLFNDILNTF